MNEKLFHGRNYNEWSYSTELAVGGIQILGYVDRTIIELAKDDPQYTEWKVENMLIMSWVYNLMERNISRSFCYCLTANEKCDSIHDSYAQKMKPC